jgi:hypothetical protein
MLDIDAMYDQFMPVMLPIALRASNNDDRLAELIIESTFDDLRRAWPLDQPIASWLSNRHAGYCLSIIKQLEIVAILKRHDVPKRDYGSWINLVLGVKIDRGFPIDEDCLNDVLSWASAA